MHEAGIPGGYLSLAHVNNNWWRLLIVLFRLIYDKILALKFVSQETDTALVLSNSVLVHL